MKHPLRIYSASKFTSPFQGEESILKMSKLKENLQRHKTPCPFKGKVAEHSEVGKGLQQTINTNEKNS